MVNLLSAGFLRLWRSRSFWVCLGVMAGVGVFEAVSGWRAMMDLRSSGVADAIVSLDSRYFIFPFLSGILLSPFCALFTGAEYSDGTIRNKLSVGHTRAAVYFSNLVLCVTAGILFCLGYIAAVLAAGFPLLGPMRTPFPVVLWYTFCAVAMTSALAALFTMIAMLCQSKAITAVICIFLAYFLLFLGIYLNNRLSEPETYPEQQYVQDGQIVTAAAHPNPNYVRGGKRAVYQFLYDLPGCQAVQLATTIDTGAPPRLPLYSLAAVLLSTGSGILLFRRKNLK